MLFNRRKRLEALASDEAAGASFWTKKFDVSARRKWVLLCNAIAQSAYDGHRFLERARMLILEDEGLFHLADPALNPEADILNYIMVSPDEMMPTVIEALDSGFLSRVSQYDHEAHDRARIFRETTSTILREYRIQYEFIDGQMVEFSSLALHANVVAPVLMLLGSEKRWGRTEQAFRDALDEISNGKPGDAITDAGTALQEALTELGCTGNALGPLIKSAKSMGLLASHDIPMLEAIDRILQWVSADRSQKGDAHTSVAPSIDDAWLAVHVVGAITLRLTKAQPRAGNTV